MILIISGEGSSIRISRHLAFFWGVLVEYQYRRCAKNAIFSFSFRFIGYLYEKWK
jgi:hypothetical protein